MLRFLFIIFGVVRTVSADLSISALNTSPFSIVASSGQGVPVINSAILSGTTNITTSAVSASVDGVVPDGGGEIDWTVVRSNVLKIQFNSSESYTGAQFTTGTDDIFYGVWEYPWNDSITNTDIVFDFKGVGNAVGVNWSNARAPFFISKAGYGVYADTLAMGSFDFNSGQAQFIFNTSSLAYYIILPTSPGDYKSIIQTYTDLSARIEMPADSGYGPTFWSDDFEQDFHGSVSNAQENYYDVINHLYYNQIHATSMFADRPYGTGNSSFGNFDFDPVFYPTPVEFIANLSTWGFDFQVWVANRAFLNTQLYNDSSTNAWLFPGISPVFFQGPALNLSIPAAYEYFLDRLSYFPSVGVKGYKIDRGEEGEMPVYEQNIQMTLFETICHTSMERVWGPSNYFSFARSAIDRSRSLTAIWNGDSHANFTGLRYSIASGIRASLLGFSTWGSDTGGYVRSALPIADQPTSEVWARWMHFSTFSPMYEIPIGTNHTPWYDPYPERLVNVLKITANEHYKLLPYIRSQTYTAAQTGIPVIRALFLEAPADPNPAVYTTSDAYFFGEAFLVAPIVESGGSRTVYFPTTSPPVPYVEYFNKSITYPAGSNTTVTLPWEYIPVYVRAGSIIPRGDVIQANNKWTPDWTPSLNIEVYPGFAIPESTFQYWTGERAVDIVMVASGGVVSVHWDVDLLGAGGTVSVVFHGKAGENVVNCTGDGREARVEGFVTLFD